MHLAIANCHYKILLRDTVTVQNTWTSAQETLGVEAHLEAGQLLPEEQAMKTENSLIWCARTRRPTVS
jgi:hypothetical protein